MDISFGFWYFSCSSFLSISTLVYVIGGSDVSFLVLRLGSPFISCDLGPVSLCDFGRGHATDQCLPVLNPVPPTGDAQ